MRIHQLLYVSHAVAPMYELQLRELVTKAQRNNSHKGLTGLLLYSSAHFMQLLEGDKRQIDALYNAIRADKRHDQVQTLLHHQIEKRLFPTWSMGLLNLEHKSEVILDRDRLQDVLNRATLFRSVDMAQVGFEALNLLKDFREQLPASKAG